MESKGGGKLMKLLHGVFALAFAPLAFAGNDAAYPTEKVAAFVFEKVDVERFRPRFARSW